MASHPKTASSREPATHAISPSTKLGQIVRLLQRTKGATLEDMEKLTGWQRHSVRGAISGSLRGKYGLKIEISVEEGRGRVYRIKKTSKAGGGK